MAENEPKSEVPRRSLTRIIAGTLFKTLAVFFSLMTFPSGLPWMIAFWLLWHVVGVLKKKPAWVPLLVCVAVVIIKRPDWSPALLAVLLGIVCVGGFRLLNWYRVRIDPYRYELSGIILVFSLGLLLQLIAFFIIYHRNANTAQVTFDPDKPIICLGDSLTAYGYPKLLSEKINAPIVDMGQDGVKSDYALIKLTEIMKHKPQAVVVELGGHDFNQGWSRRHAKINLVTLIEVLKDSGIQVIIVEIPRGFISDGYDGLERELARKHDLQLVSDWTIRSFVLFSPICPPGMWIDKKWHLSRDGLHPNQKGNEAFAEDIKRALQKIYGDDVIKQ